MLFLLSGEARRACGVRATHSGTSIYVKAVGVALPDLDLQPFCRAAVKVFDPMQGQTAGATLVSVICPAPAPASPLWGAGVTVYQAPALYGIQTLGGPSK